MIIVKWSVAFWSVMAVLVAFPLKTFAQVVTIQGRDFIKDGKQWLPKGIQVEGLNRPITPALSESMNKSAKRGRGWWGAAELDAVSKIFHGDIIRFQVSQPGLDPQSSIYTPEYLTELLSAFRLARSRGFVVIVSMDAQAENGGDKLACGHGGGMPNDSTVRAWKTLAPTLLHDKGIMLELYNEPCRDNWTEAQKEWSQEMQSMIEALRALGSENILLLDGLQFAQSTNNLFTLIHDSLPNRLAMAVHPYVNSLKGVDLDNLDGYFNSHFGLTAAKYPLIATEWNATPTNACVGDVTPKVAMSVVRFLQSHHVGLIGWAIDSNYGKMVKDHIKYEPTDYKSFSGCSKTPAESGGGSLVANFPNN